MSTEKFVTSVHSSIIHNSPKSRKQLKCPSTTEWLRNIRVCPYDGILFSNKKELILTDVIVEKPQKPMLSEKAKNKWHTIYDSIYKKYPNKEHLDRQKVD